MPLAERGIDNAIVSMRLSATVRLQARLNTLMATRAGIAARSEAALDAHRHHTDQLARISRPPTTVDNAPSRGFRVQGQVTTADGGTPVPGLRFRLVDVQGVVVLERPEWATAGDGRYQVDVSARDAKANESARVELADAEGNPLERLDRAVVPGDTVQADVALDPPAAGTVLAAQASAGKAQAARIAQLRERLQTSVDAVKSRQQLDQATIDAEIERLHSALKSLSG